MTYLHSIILLSNRNVIQALYRGKSHQKYANLYISKSNLYMDNTKFIFKNELAS